MEDQDLETPFENPPNRRRRPLKSQTFDTFIRILSECQLHFQKQEQVATFQGDQLGENNDSRPEDGLARGESLVDGNREGDLLVENNDLRPEDGLARTKSLVNENRECDQLVENHDSRPKDGLAREKSMGNENREVVSSQDIGDHMDVDGLDCVDNVKIRGCQENVDHINGMESVIEGNQICNNDFAAFTSLIDSDDQFNLPDVDTEEFGLGEHLGDKAPCVDVSELIDSLLETDVTVGSSIPVDTKDENNSHVKRNEIETRAEVRESVTPLSASVMVSSSLQKTVEGIEDGEISEVPGFLEKSSDLLHEDVSLEKNSSDKGELSGDIIQKQGFSPNALLRGLEKDTQYFGLSKNGVNITSTAMNVEMGNENQNLLENRTKVYYGDTVEDDRAERMDSRLELGRNRRRCGPKEANSQASCPKKISLSGGSTGENTIENQCSASTEKVANQDNRKRKGGCSEERKPKRKKKEKMKRAEKNRELGVKKLKLPPPVSKPKTVIYCRHFLKGSCHEGDKCKFSHDTIPLTKSKPCCHFARQSCMKGDDCPFDHQLSKYPCNSYLSQGSCIRGPNCMFSHKVPVKEGSSTASDICNSDLRSLSAEKNSDLKKQMNPHATGKQNASTQLCSSGVSHCKNKKQNGEGTALKPAGHAPKGISFLSHGKVPSGNMSKHGQGDLYPKADNGAKVDQQTIDGASDVVESLNKNTQRTPVVPRGVNFLSFGKAPFESSRTKNSPLSDPAKSERAGLPQASSSPLPHDRSLGKLIDVQSKSSLSSFQGSLLSNTPSSVQKALHSTLALAAKFESKAKNDRPCNSHAVITDLSKEGSSSQNKSTKASTILDFLYGANGKTMH